MPRKLMALAVALFCFAALAGADDKDKKDDKTKPTKAKVECVTLNISRKLDEKQFGFSGEMTLVSLLVTVPGKQLLTVDASSKLTKFADDKDASLIDDNKFFPTNFGTFPRVSTDRTAMVVSIQNYKKAPTRGATKLLIKGDLVAVCGLEEKTTAEGKVEFKRDAKAKAGDHEITVYQEKGFGDEGPSFAVNSTSANVKSVTVKDGDGKAVEVLPRGSSGFGKSWSFNFALKKPLKEGKVSVTYFSKEEKMTIPVDLSITVGP